MGDLQILELQGENLAPWLEPLGTLRIRVFREFPYLYDGSLDYERDYLQTYLNTPDSLVVLVLDAASQVVGATTCLPLRDECAEFCEPFSHSGIDLETICYFGESILLPELRGMGIGKEFFRLREAHARRLGLEWAAFCAVDRPPNHPARPANYRPLDAFWAQMGFQKRQDLQAEFAWKEIGETRESTKKLTFWLKSCAGGMKP